MTADNPEWEAYILFLENEVKGTVPSFTRNGTGISFSQGQRKGNGEKLRNQTTGMYGWLNKLDVCQGNTEEERFYFTHAQTTRNHGCFFPSAFYFMTSDQ